MAIGLAGEVAHVVNAARVVGHGAELGHEVPAAQALDGRVVEAVEVGVLGVAQDHTARRTVRVLRATVDLFMTTRTQPHARHRTRTRTIEHTSQRTDGPRLRPGHTHVVGKGLAVVVGVAAGSLRESHLPQIVGRALVEDH